MHSVAEILRALQLDNLIACVVRDYLLIIGGLSVAHLQSLDLGL